MATVIRLNTANNKHELAATILRAVEHGVYAAISQMTADQLKELMMEPYREIAAELDHRQAA